MPRDFSKFVHLHRGKWVVAQYLDGRYYAPQRFEVRQVTGCHTTFGSLDYVFGDAYKYTDKSRALAKARELFG